MKVKSKEYPRRMDIYKYSLSFCSNICLDGSSHVCNTLLLKSQASAGLAASAAGVCVCVSVCGLAIMHS